MKKTYNFLESNVFIIQANEVHDGKYEYLINKDEWIGSQTKIRIVCPFHGEFLQIASVHKRSGCRECGKIKRGLATRITFDAFLEKATERWGDRFEYFRDEWIAMEVKTVIRCLEHGRFNMLPRDHLNKKYGCGKCGDEAIGRQKRTTVEQLVTKAETIYGKNTYDYSRVVTKSYNHLITVICPQHGSFERRMSKFLLGRGCPTCKLQSGSKIANRWLDGLGISGLIKEYRITPSKPVDGYDPATNTVYEFHGDFWHGNPDVFNPQDINPKTGKTYQYHYEKTLLSEKAIRDMGYNLVVMWEYDYLRG